MAPIGVRSRSPREPPLLTLSPPPRAVSPCPRRDVTPHLRPHSPRHRREVPAVLCTPPEGEVKKSKSIQDLIKQLGRAVVSRSKSPRRSSCLLEVPSPSFRSRSRSLDDGTRKPSDCEATYRIYDQILAEGALRRSSLEKRRLSLGGGVTGHRGSEPSLDPNHAAILFRDSRGLPVADPFLEKVSISDLEEDESQIFVKFFKFHKCYGLIPTSAKLVVFDTQLLVKKAFFALLHNGVRAAPLWDSSQHKFVGMLTITDFIKILHMYYRSGTMSLEQMEEHKLDTWRALLKDSPDLVSIDPDASLYDAIRVLIQNRIHRLPVIDPETGNVLYILTHKRILRFLFLYMNDLPRPSYLDKSLSEVGIGTYDCIETAFEDTTIISALDKFLDRRVSALPVVDSEGKLVDIFAKFDVINLAAEKTYDKLDMPLKKANENRNDWFEGVHKCSMDDTLYSIIERLVRAEVHRLVVTDDEDKVIGILSLSDLLQYLVLRPCGDDIGLGSRCESPLSQLQSEETILEGEEEECDSLEPLATPTSFTREVTVSGGE
nr:5'-AMP-activated protein kinase subunit gamma-1 [Halyomorpha halys]